MPKQPSDSRPTFSADLKDDLLRVARERGRPETEISPLLEALAQEWIEKGSFQRRQEELDEISSRLVAVEEQLRILAGVPIPLVPGQPKKNSSASKLDNLASRILEHLVEIADVSDVTSRVTAQEIAAALAKRGGKPTEKQVTERIKKLIAEGLISIEEDSGGRGGRRYRVESQNGLKP